MLNKNELENLKQTNLQFLYERLEQSDTQETLFILEHLGYLPLNFEGHKLLPFLKSDNPKIQFYAIKNLAKLKDFQYAERLFDIAMFNADSSVRREATSALGRMRIESAIPFLLNLLGDKDAKVVLQAIRGLLVFKDQTQVNSVLKGLRFHPNEMVQTVIEKEFFPSGLKTPDDSAQKGVSEHLQNCVVLGDVIETLEFVSDESIHLTFTSPPYYNARDYSTYVSYQAYLDFLQEVFSQVHRVTKEGRFLIVNTSPVIVPRVSRAHSSKRYPIPFDLHARLVNIGWEFIDDIVWAKPENTVKNRNGGFMQHRKPLAYKPNPVTEYLMVYRKKTDKLLDWNIRQYDAQTVEQSKVKENYESSNLWRVDPTYDKVHSAVFPLELCRRVITFYSYVGDLVFDPFAGSGTLGKAAQILGRNFFLTEKDPAYFERIQEIITPGDMFCHTHFLTLEEFQKIVKK